MASAAHVAGLAALAAAALLLSLALAQLLWPRIAFWPPPDPASWQNRAFRSLFRVMFYGLLIDSAGWLWLHAAGSSVAVLATSAALVAAGLGVALASTGVLGWGNAFGAQDGLRTDGIFAWSRNPIYVATFLAQAGWALGVADPVIRATLALWALLYLAAIFLEERWLSERYGAAFADYCRRVRRFL